MKIFFLASLAFVLTLTPTSVTSTCFDDIASIRNVLSEKAKNPYLVGEAQLPDLAASFSDLFALFQSGDSLDISTILAFLKAADNADGTSPCGTGYVARFLKGAKDTPAYPSSCAFADASFNAAFLSECAAAGGTVRSGSVKLSVGAGFDLAKILTDSGLIPDNLKTLVTFLPNVLAIKTGDYLSMSNVVKFCQPASCASSSEDLEDQLVDGVDNALEGLGLFSSNATDVVSAVVGSIPGTVTMSSCGKSSGAYSISIEDLSKSLEASGGMKGANLSDETCDVCGECNKKKPAGGSFSNRLAPPLISFLLPFLFYFII